jgi:hypothetical protein
MSGLRHRSPMSPGWTQRKMARPEGVEPPTFEARRELTLSWTVMQIGRAEQPNRTHLSRFFIAR